MDNISGSECRKCGQRIYWHRSKAGKFYPTDSAEDRRDFHKCGAPAARTKPQPTVQKPGPTTPDFDPEPSLEQRVHDLEQIVGNLIRTVQQVQSRQPIDDQDVAF